MYFACSQDQTLFGEHSLPALLALVRDVCDRAEDVAVWHRNLIVAVYADRRFVWLRPEHRPAEEAAAVNAA
jgi:hypothetical protein